MNSAFVTIISGISSDLSSLRRACNSPDWCKSARRCSPSSEPSKNSRILPLSFIIGLIVLSLAIVWIRLLILSIFSGVRSSISTSITNSKTLFDCWDCGLLLWSNVWELPLYLVKAVIRLLFSIFSPVSSDKILNKLEAAFLIDCSSCLISSARSRYVLSSKIHFNIFVSTSVNPLFVCFFFRSLTSISNSVHERILVSVIFSSFIIIV